MSVLDLILPEPRAKNTGLISMTADEYHADLRQGPSSWAPPSLSSSVVKLLLDRSPAHARMAHPRLNPDYQDEPEKKFDLGTVAHELLLEGESAVCVVDAADWRTKAAKEQADEARAKGQTPLLEKDWARVEAMANAARRQLELVDLDPAPLTNGAAEQVLLWDDDGVMCRCRFDWIHHDLLAVDDLKTTSASADPARWQRTMFQIGADIQAAFYLRGLRKAFGVVPEWRFLVQETYPPYALSVVTLSPALIEHAERRVEQAIQLWKRCLKDNHWPSYSRVPAVVELPSWMLDPGPVARPAPEDFGDEAPF